jgi:lipopolysaccharide export system protein LptA
MRRTVLLISLAIALLPGPELRASAPVPVDYSSQPIVIKSKELFTDTTSRTATFSGTVAARQGDLTIYSDRLDVHYAEKGGEVEQVEASGNVRIVQGNRLGTAGRAVYYSTAGKIILTEAPKVYQGKDFVTGKVITYFLAEGKSLVDGGDDARVQAVIHPAGKRDNGGSN